MTSCSQLDDYVAGRLGNGDTAAFEAHAATCANCGKAVARKKAVERAAKVLKRNEVTRGPGLTPASNSFFEEPAATPAPQPARPAMMPTPDYDAPSPGGNRRVRLLVAGAAGLVALVCVLIFGSRDRNDQPPPSNPPPLEAPVAAAQAPVPSEPELQAPPPATAKPVPEEPQLEPAPPPVVATPVQPPTKAPAAVDPKLEFYPVGTEFELLEETIAGKKCGMAVSALRARVQKDPTEARSWSLLAQCYVKRKRWKNAIEAYDMVVKHGDAAMANNLTSVVEKARAGLQAEADAAAAAETTPPPTPAVE